MSEGKFQGHDGRLYVHAFWHIVIVPTCPVPSRILAALFLGHARLERVFLKVVCASSPQSTCAAILSYAVYQPVKNGLFLTLDISFQFLLNCGEVLPAQERDAKVCSYDKGEYLVRFALSI